MPTVNANGIDICYDTRGEGVPVLLIMGIGCQLIHWRDDFCDLLAAQGCCVIRMDNRDMGHSTHMDGQRPPTVAQMAARRSVGLPIEAPYLLEDMAQDAVGLLDALGIPQAVVVGASMGGMIAQTMAIHHPQRVAGMVSIMSHTGERRFLVGKVSAIKVMLEGGPPRSPEEAGERVIRIMDVLASPAYPTDPASYREMGAAAYARDSDPRGFGRQLAAILASGSRAKQLPDITAPTLVIHGEADPLIPISAGRRLASLIPHAELWEVAGMGHDMPAQIWPDLTQRIGALAQSSGKDVTSSPSKLSL
jgi:pimeloyl-ACP methyl ester carboxylesterase